MKTKTIYTITLWANRVVAALVAVLIFALPALLRWYAGLLDYTPVERDFRAFIVAFWCCSVAIFFALWNMKKLMHNILEQRIFVRENVRRVRRVRLRHSCF